MKLKQEWTKMEEQLANMPAESSFGRYFEWLNQLVAENQKNDLYKNTYLPMVRQEEKARAEHKPFLTVLTRTQGKRPEMLRETLLSLVGQSDHDFELILVGHKLEEDQKAMVEQIIHEQPEMLRRRIRFVELDHGNRTTPLNVGFALAHGQYVAVLDDDDIVMDHWVESFHHAAKDHEGMILHAYVFAQDWETVATDTGRNALRAVAAPEANYCVKFDILTQMRLNRCPLLGLAFPTYYFHEMGFIFDETLTTTEDWDYLMRLSSFAGVTDIEEATSIYRLWKNTETSATLHDASEWKENYLVIQDKIMDMSLIIPSGNRKGVSQESMNAISAQWQSRAPVISCCALYLNHGNGFSQQDILMENALYDGRDFDVRFDLTDEDASDLQEIRFDACEDGMFVLENLFALAKYQDGTIGTFDMDQCRCNGAKAGNAICFLKSDPWVVWNVPSDKKLKSLRVIGETHVNMTDDLVQEACRMLGGTEFQLFYSTQKKQFCEEQSACVSVPYGRFAISFPIETEQPITDLRLDPGEQKNCILSDVEIQLISADGTVINKKLKGASTNGKQVGGMYVFDQADPQIIWQVGGQSLSEVKISGIFAYSSANAAQA